MKTYKRIGMAAVSTAALVAVAGCQGSGADDKAADKAPKLQSRATAVKTLTAAYEKTAEAKSAKVEMTMSIPGSLGETKMSGVMGWDPTVMDMTMSGAPFADRPGAPEQIRMIWRDNVMYMDMGSAAPAELDGKRWMKMDLGAMAEKAGAPGLEQKLTGGIDNMNQDPAKQMAMLLESPSLKHLGSTTIDGQKTQHYKGTLTIEEMLDTNESAYEFLDEKDRQELLKNAEKSGIKGYDTEIWVNEDGYPAKVNLGIDSPEGAIEMTQTYSDYGAKAEVEVPPAAETLDMMKMFEELGQDGGLEG
ncbi:hypothetical protein H9Y04_43030 [Streptomyces sp. TRM66268-LWL]|uniref:Lipoprotein n=1 Tax=Streptomyces polyasparticus TaxID=2767826 RepID=A0ABR7SY66_9ACTN|nr:hypothetical protein [Streptomyces polyasparticus]MBC9719308.1 hypothetical protein [Streptomyces polyasparticus]